MIYCLFLYTLNDKKINLSASADAMISLQVPEFPCRPAVGSRELTLKTPTEVKNGEYFVMNHLFVLPNLKPMVPRALFNSTFVTPDRFSGLVSRESLDSSGKQELKSACIDFGP